MTTTTIRGRAMGAAMALALLAGTAAGQQAFLSELFINPPGSPDDGRESVEITGTPGLSLAGWKLIIIDGDTAFTPPATSGPAGTVDAIIDLGSYTIGSNGVLLIRDGTQVLLPAPEAGTNVVIFNFNPDLENGGNTFILGFGDLPPEVVVGADLDPTNSGVLNTTLSGFTVVDAVAYVNGDEDGLMYAEQFGGFNIPRQLIGAAGPWTPDALYRFINANGTAAHWGASDILTLAGQSATGPFYIDDTEFFGWGTSGAPEIPSPNPPAGGPGVFLDLGRRNITLAGPACYANCDGSTGTPLLTPADFVCFLNKFRAGDAYANCDGSTGTPALTPADFVCFLNKFRAGC